MITKARLIYTFLFLITIGIGLISREIAIIPLWIGDALWAVMIFWLMALLFPSFQVIRLMLVSLAICYVVEISQLYQAEWINELRRTLPGRLILGQGFLWSDLWAYTIGVFTAGVIQKKILSKMTY